MGNPIEQSITVPTMQTYGQRVRAAREYAGLSQEKLAKELGIKQPSVFALENNQGADSSKHTLKIARITGVRLEWLETGAGPMAGEASARLPAPLQPAETATLNFQAMPKDLPVMGNASCGEDGLFELNGQILDHVRRPPRLMGVKDAYALWISGESMAPWREHGGLVVVHPHRPVRNNDYVVVQLKPAGEGEQIPAYIKRLVRRTPTSLVLLQHNPKKEISVPMSKVLAIHRILDWDEAMGI